MRLQPLLGVLFRPEEVVLPSASASVDVGFRRRDLDEFAPIKDQADAVRAVSARVVDHHPLAAEPAADQQQEVNRSGDVELLAAFQGDRVEVEAQAR